MTAPFEDKINAALGLFVSVFSYVFGEHWILFAAFLILNFGDYLSRWIAARITKTESSKKALPGIAKKIGYWLMIALAFGVSVVFIEIGEVIHIDLHVTTLLGWFVLATLIVNEIRSILENLVDGGFKVPAILIKGLEVADKAIDKIEDNIMEEK